MDTKVYFRPLGVVFFEALRSSSLPSPSLLSASSLSLSVGVVGLYGSGYRLFGLPRNIFLSFVAFGVTSDTLENGGRLFSSQLVAFCMVCLMLSKVQSIRIINQLLNAGYIIGYKEGRRKYYEFTPRAREKYQALKAHCQQVESRRAAYIREALEILDKKKSG